MTKHTRSECSGEECVTCNKLVNDEGVECQWCFNWEHKGCAGLTHNEYNLLSKSSGKVMFYCSLCHPKVSLALDYQWQATDNKLQHERKSDNQSYNFYFYRLPHLWNALPIINYKLLCLETIKYKLQNYFYTQFEQNFISSNACTYSFLCPCSHCNKSPDVPNYDYL